jgi:hypothetical protein
MYQHPPRCDELTAARIKAILADPQRPPRPLSG